MMSRQEVSQDSRSKKLFKVLFFLAIIVIIGVSIYFIQDKTWFHDDEFYTYGTANNPMNPRVDYFNQWVPGQAYADFLKLDPADRFTFGAVVDNLIIDSHPPLYYFLIHFISSLFPGQFSIWMGLGLNIFIHVLSFVYLYKLGLTLSENKYLSLGIALYWSLTPGAMSSVVLTRMYELMGLFVLGAVYHLMTYLKTNKSSQLMLFAGSVVLGCLTHYYYFIFIVPLCALVALYMLIKKDYSTFKRFVPSALAAGIIAIILNPNFIEHMFFSSRGTQTLDILSKGQLSRFINSSSHYWNYIRNGLFAGLPQFLFFLVIIISLLALILIWQKGERKGRFYVILSLNLLIYYLAISLLSPLVHARYIYGVYGLIVLSVFLNIHLFIGIWIAKPQTHSIILASLMLILLVISHQVGEVDNQYYEYEPVKAYLSEKDEEVAVALVDYDYRLTKKIFELQAFDQVYAASLEKGSMVLPDLDEFESVVVYHTNTIDLKDYEAFDAFSSVEELYAVKDYVAHRLTK